MNEFDQAAAQMLQDTDPMEIAAGQLVDEQRSQTRASLYSSLLQNPDVAARATALGKRVGLPGSLVQRNLPEVERRVRMDDFDRVLDGSPALAKWLADQNNAAVAHDNVDNMGAIERKLRQFGGGIGEAFGMSASGAGVLADVLQRTAINDFATIFLPEPQRGPMGLEPQKPTIESLAGPLIGEGFRQAGGAVKDYSRQNVAGVGDKTFADQVAGGIGQVVGQALMLPFTRGLGLYAQGADAMNDKVAGDMADQRTKDLAILGGAAVTGATEAWALDKLLGPLAVPIKNQVGAALARIGIASAAEGGQEFSENVLQDTIRKALTNRDAEINIGQSVGEGGVGAVVGGIVRTVVESALHIRTRGVQKVQQAEQDGQNIAELNDLAKADKLLARDPESFQQFIDQAAQDGPVDTVYIDAKTLMQSGLAQQLAQVSPAVAQQLELAAQTGAQIAIPVGEYTARIAPTDFAQGLLEHLKTDPDGFTVAEAREYQQSGADQQFQQEVERTLAEKQGDTLFNASRDAVQMKIQQELDALGRFTPEKNAADAVLFASYYATRAAQLGVTPEALYEQRRVRFAAEAVAGQRFDQGMASNSPNTENPADKSSSNTRSDSLDSALTQQDQAQNPQSAISGALAAIYGSQDLALVKTPDGSSIDLAKNPGGFNQNKGASVESVSGDGAFWSRSGWQRVGVKAPVSGGVNGDSPPGRMVRHVSLSSPRSPEARLLLQSERSLAGLHRFTSGDANTGVGYMMFADDAESVRSYGSNHWTVSVGAVSQDEVVDVEDIVGDIADVLSENAAGLLVREYGAEATDEGIDQVARKLASEAVTEDIVDSAGFWDAPDLVEVVYEHLLQPRGIKVVATPDGAIVFDRSAVEAIVDDEVFNQQARGAFSPESFTITLLKGADLSTALHEGAHFFFENDIALAADLVRENGAFGADTQTEGERQIIADVSKLLKWHGISGTIDEQLATWYGMDFEAKRAAHERTAESFERYLFEGNAPSVELAAYFLKFRAWMVNVYKSIRDFLARNPEAGKLDDTVRGVFDRMLATAEQVKMAEQGRSMLPLFASPDQGGMTPEEFAAYQAQGVEATAEAIHKLEARTLRDLAWARNARGREITKLQKKAAGLRKEVRMEARREIMSQPVYRAWEFLTGRAETLPLTPEQQAARDEHRLDMVDWEQRRSEHKAEKTRELRNQAWEASDLSKAEYETPQKRGMAKGQFLMRNRREIELSAEQSAVQWEKFNPKPKAPEIAREDGQNVQNGEVGKLQLSEVESMGLPDDVIASLIDRKMTAKSDGWHPDPLAEEFGFGSGDEMVRALAAAEPPASVIESLTDRMMMERHGELATQEAIEQAADQAIHNEARARMVATEANALAQAAGQRKVLADAAKQFAAQVVARLKVRDVKPSRFSNAAARAAQNAEKASRAGDIATAAAEKRNQMVQTYAAKAAHDAREEVEAAVGYLKKFDRKGVRENLDAGYLDQIDALLDRYDLSLTASAADRRASLRTWVQSRLNAGEIPAISESLLTPDERAAYLAEVQSRDADGELVYKDDEEAIKLLADAIDRSAKRSYKDMTVEEFRGLVDTVKNIEHLARLKNKLLSQRDERAYEAVRDEMADAIVQNASKSGKNTPTATDWLGRSFQAVKDFGASHIKVATWARIMDGGKDNGPVWRYLVQPANERSTMETTMRAEATERLAAILDPILKDVPTADKWGKGRHFPTLGRALNWQQRFAVALNVGNESNLQRLLGGDGWTYAQILPVLNSLSAREWQAVQAVWDHFETYRPLIAAKEKRVTGTEPEWIQARPITVATADGQTVTLPGGYFPVVFDPRVNMKAEADSKSQEFKDLAKAAYSAATTRRGFTKQRVQELNGRPLMLSLQGLYTATNDVIHDLAWHEWVIDANKLLKSKTIDKAIREHYGAAVKDQFTKWRDDIVMGTRRMDHSVEQAVGFLRQSVSASALTFNLLSAAQQPLGLANSVARVGAKWIGRGVARYVSAPFESTSEAMEKSAWLKNRTRTRFRELNELRNQVQGQTAIKELAGRYGYWLMMRTQLMVDVPTWWGAYEKAIADGQDEATAVQLADQSVKDAQGGGEEVDLAGIERGNALTKVFTTFYSYMGSTLNVAYLAGKTDASRARAVANILLVTMTPAILGTLLKDALIPGGDDDEEKLTKKLIGEQITFLMGMVVVGREFAQAGKMLSGDGGMAYSGPGGLRVIGDVTKLAQQTAQGEFDEGFLRAFISVTGGLTGLPAVQANRTLQGISAIGEGQTDGALESAAALAFGMQR